MTLLARRLGLADAITIGLGAMLGAGVFAALAPAAGAAGSGLLLGLALAALVAYCNASSSARLAARYPESGGTYVYGRRRLGPVWGYLAGWTFVIGKTASCAAMALTFASYAAPGHTRAFAVAAIVGLTLLTLSGVHKTLLATRVIVAVVLLVLAAVVIACFAGDGDAVRLDPVPDATWTGVLRSAGFLFFAFAGYARLATLGEEVREPQRTIPRAVACALAITVLVYAAVATAALFAAGAPALAASSAPLRTAVEAAGAESLGPIVRVGAAVAALGALLALLLGVSRTTLAMARDRHLPRPLAEVGGTAGVPRNAELAVAAVVVVLVLTVDLRAVIGFSSFGVLLYYAIANVSAWTLRADERRPPRWVPVVGVVGCIALAANLPLNTVLIGAGVTLAGLAGYLLTRCASD